jgi:hypothetical protein
VRKSYWVLLIFVLIGGLLGGVLGEILRVMAPHGTIQSIFATNFSPGISPFSIDLVLLKFTLGFELKINLLSRTFSRMLKKTASFVLASKASSA